MAWQVNGRYESPGWSSEPFRRDNTLLKHGFFNSLKHHLFTVSLPFGIPLNERESLATSWPFETCQAKFLPCWQTSTS